MQRLKNRAQFEAAMAGGIISRTAHFVLHRLVFDGAVPPSGPDSSGAQALFAVRSQPHVGAVVPKRWAKRAVTRNGIKRQIYTLSATFESSLPCAAHVVRLRSGFAREAYPSAWSDALKKVVRSELLQLFERAAAGTPARSGGHARAPGSCAVPAGAGPQP